MTDAAASDDYDIWWNDELKQELTWRKLPTEGDREALIARLRKDDDEDDERDKRAPGKRMKSYWL